MKIRDALVLLAPLALLGPLGAAAPAAAAEAAPAAVDDQPMEEIVIRGVRASEQKSVDLKRESATIQDSIVAEDIGKLPDVTISDSLQRIPGVQIDRDSGEGADVNIRGLPQIGTLLNGETFLTTSSITSSQANFGDIPSQLFSGADVYKSATADILNAGLTGTIGLRTRRPFDLARGWTTAGALQAERGGMTGKNSPGLDGLLAYHGERFGFVAAGSWSDVTLENSQDGIGQYGGIIHGETTDSTLASDGFLNAYLGAPLPPGMTLLTPAQCTNAGGSWATVAPGATTGCEVDVNGDGQASSNYYNTEDFVALDQQKQRKRIGFTLSAQAQLAPGWLATGDFFYTGDRSYNRTNGYQLNSASWLGATFLPLQARATGVKVYNGYNQADPNSPTPQLDFQTMQKYQFYMGDIETFSNDAVDHNQSTNYNLQLDYDRGGPFTASVRAIYARASALHMESYLQFAVSDGNAWPNEPIDAAPPGSIVVPGGTRVFDPYGFPANTVPATIDLNGAHGAVTLPAWLQQTLRNPDAWRLKTVASENDYDQSADMSALRLDGHYRFSDAFKVDFGARQGRRSADKSTFALVAPVFGGNGAYENTLDANGDETATVVTDATGCYVRYKAADVLLDGGGIPGACKAGSPVTGFYRANPYAGYSPSQLPAIVANNVKLYERLAGVSGVSVWDMDPRIMDEVLAFQNALYPGEVRSVDPGNTWHVQLDQTTAYVQGNFKLDWQLPVTGNLGVKFIRTALKVDQHKVGDYGPYYVNATDLGITRTSRAFTDVLPSLNVAVELKPDLKLRVAAARNMQLLNLDEWGGGLALEYAIVAGTSPPIIGVQGGSQGGSPALNPWRSDNFDLSLEWYPTRSSVVSIAAFQVDVTSYVQQGSTLRCDLPDLDNVVRHRCVAISGPVQGSGNGARLHGFEFGLKQAFTFLPGWLASFGADVNYTYSPSTTGHDVSGQAIPFQDNSRDQANVVLWYERAGFQARLAGNYRSRRAVEENYAGITGFEEYQAPTHYYDLSASYDVTRHVQVYAQGSNITKESEHYYLVWPDEKLLTQQFEARWALGVRGRF